MTFVLVCSDLIINCLKLRRCFGSSGSNADFADSNAGFGSITSFGGSDFGCLAFGFFCEMYSGDCDLIIKWFGDGSLNNGFGGGGIGRFEAGGLGSEGASGGGIGSEGARGGGIGKNEGGRKYRPFPR